MKNIQIFGGNVKKFNPKELFKNNEQGVWYDPSDINRYMSNLGPELVSNGTFENTTGWTAVIGTISAVDGKLRVGKSADNIGRASFQLNCVIGRTYYVSLERYKGQNTATNVAITITHSSVTGAIYTNETSVDGLFNFSFTATQTSHWLFLATVGTVGVAGLYSEFDNVKIKEIINDTIGGELITMYQDTLGIIPVTGVEQPVGLMLDKSRGTIRGPELIPNGDFSTTTNWSTPAGWVISGGVCTATTTVSSLKYSSVCTAGRFYIVEFDWTHTAGTLYVRVGTGPAITFTTSGRKRVILMANDTNGFEAYGGAVSGMLDNISVKEVYGNHAYQTTAIDRPILRNRYNMLTKTEQFSNGVWEKATSNGTAIPVVTDKYAIDPLGGFNASRVQITLPGDSEWSLVRTVGNIANIPANKSVTISLWIKAADLSQIGKYINIYTYNTTAASYPIGKLVSQHILTNQWRQVKATFSFDTVSNSQEFSIGKARSSVTNGLLNSQTSTDFLIWGAQFTFQEQETLPYQMVDTATVYDSDFSKFPVYLACNGINTGMKTNNFNLSSSPYLGVFTNIGTKTTTPMQMIVEHSSFYASNAGAFQLSLNEVNTGGLAFARKGTTVTIYRYETPAKVAPRNVIMSGLINVNNPASANIIMRTNYTTSTVSGGGGAGSTGSGANVPLYLFRRGLTTAPFNGDFYGLIIRGANTTEKQIKDIEKYLYKKSKIIG